MTNHVVAGEDELVSKCLYFRAEYRLLGDSLTMNMYGCNPSVNTGKVIAGKRNSNRSIGQELQLLPVNSESG